MKVEKNKNISSRKIQHVKKKKTHMLLPVIKTPNRQQTSEKL